MPIVVVVDTNVLRYALEEEKKIRESEETRRAYEVLVKLLSSGRAVIVFNPKTIEEYSRHINAVRAKLRKRMSPAFSLLRIIMKSKAIHVPLEKHSFEVKGEPIGRKDLHLLDSAKSGALLLGEKEALVLTFAEDVYRAKEAKNGKGVVIKIVNMRAPEDVKLLLAYWLATELE